MADYSLHIIPTSGGAGYEFTPLTPKIDMAVNIERSGDTDKITALIETWKIEALFFSDTVTNLWAAWNAFVLVAETMLPFHVELRYGGVIKRKLSYGASLGTTPGRLVHSIQILRHSIKESPARYANNMIVEFEIKAKQYTTAIGTGGAKPPSDVRRTKVMRATAEGITETWSIWVKDTETNNAIGIIENYKAELKGKYRNKNLDSASFTHNLDEDTYQASFTIKTAEEGELYSWAETISFSGGGRPISFLPMSGDKEPSVVVGAKRGLRVTISVEIEAETKEEVQNLFIEKRRLPSWTQGRGGFSTEAGNIVPEGDICVPVPGKRGRAGTIKSWKIKYTQNWAFNKIDDAVLTGLGLKEAQEVEKKPEESTPWE